MLVNPEALREGRIHVAVPDLRMAGDVAVARQDRQRGVAGPIGMQRRRTGRQRRFGFEYRGQGLELGLDQRRRVLGDLEERGAKRRSRPS